MSFTPIDSATIAAGQAVKEELLATVKADFDDHESRLIVAEAAIGRLPPISFDVVGALTSPLAMDGALIYRVEANLRVTAARLLVKTAGSAGSVTVDIEYKRGAGSWTSILASTISAVYTLGDYSVVSGTLATQDFQTGDLFRLNIDAVQTNMQDFSVYLENESA
jgi:hypothetical protein